MAAATGSSQSTIRRMWMAFGSQPRAADDDRDARTPEPQLRAARDDLAGRRSRSRLGVRHRQVLQATPRNRVLALPQRSMLGPLKGLTSIASWTTTSPTKTSKIKRALHADLGVMDQSGRALVCRTHQKSAPTAVHASVRQLQAMGHLQTWQARGALRATTDRRRAAPVLPGDQACRTLQ